jgi:hypothetical protein
MKKGKYDANDFEDVTASKPSAEPLALPIYAIMVSIAALVLVLLFLVFGHYRDDEREQKVGALEGLVIRLANSEGYHVEYRATRSVPHYEEIPSPHYVLTKRPEPCKDGVYVTDTMFIVNCSRVIDGVWSGLHGALTEDK